MPSFADVMDTKVEDIKFAPPFPVGSYLAMTEGMPEWGKSSQKQSDQIQFKAKLLQALENVDKEKLAEWAEETGENVVGQQAFLTFYTPPRLAEFLKNLGLGHLSQREAISESPGRRFIITFRHRPSQDGKRINHEVESTAAA